VSEVAVTFPETRDAMGGRGVVTGNPVRRQFTLVQPRPAGAAVHHLLVFGGSQGSRILNQTMTAALPLLSPLRGRLTITHQTGEAALSAVTQAYRDAGWDEASADVRPFIPGMAQAFEQADLVLCRSGATTVAELTAAGRPAVLVPFAGAAHDHQTFNARKLEQAGAAIVLIEADLSGDILATALRSLLEDPPRVARMAQASRAAGRHDAAARIADLCVGLLSRGRAA
jgi:UDP-N-acetylglucosamine--N-acetylmuramyl-(pentapeptide) pyrophosphoryl-undecaprenol N-acetylglucosamine transferase